MNPAIINALLIIFITFGVAIYMVVLWVRHRVFIDKSIIKDGVLKSTGGRYRLAKNGKFYAMFDFLHKNPVVLEDAEEYLIACEGMPFFGIKQCLNVTIHVEKVPKEELDKSLAIIEEMRKYNLKKALQEIKKLKKYRHIISPWVVPDNFNKEGELDEYTYSWSLNKRIEAYEETKHLSKQEMMLRFYIPMGLIVLAALLIIFYPRILAAVRDPALDLVNNRLTAWTDILTRFR